MFKGMLNFTVCLGNVLRIRRELTPNNKNIRVRLIMKISDYNKLAMTGILHTNITSLHPFATSIEKKKITEQRDNISGKRYNKEFHEFSNNEFMAEDRKEPFRADRPVKCGKFAALLARALELPAPQSHFSSLESAYPSSKDEINRATTVGIINGRGNSFFAPHDTITRKDVVTKIDSTLQQKEAIDSFGQLPFIDHDAAYIKTALQRVCKFGIINENQQKQQLTVRNQQHS